MGEVMSPAEHRAEMKREETLAWALPMCVAAFGLACAAAMVLL